MNIGGIRTKVLKKVGDLELSMLIDIDIYTNKDTTETSVTPIGYLLSGGQYGEHRLSIDSSNTRLSAHWKGYLEANGVDTGQLRVNQIYFN